MFSVFTTGPGMLVLSIVAGAIVFTLLVIAVLFVFYCKRCHRRKLHKRRDKLLDNQEALSNRDHDCSGAVLEETRKSLEQPDGRDGCRILGEKKSFLNMDWSIV